MNKKQFRSLKPGTKVRYNMQTVTVSCWLEPGEFIEYTNGTNTKVTDPWLEKMKVLAPV